MPMAYANQPSNHRPSPDYTDVYGWVASDYTDVFLLGNPADMLYFQKHIGWVANRLL